jgi:hypothetical protein
MAYFPPNDIIGSGNITTQNLNPNTGTATASSTVSINNLDGRESIGFHITANTLNQVLTPQFTINGIDWLTATVINIQTKDTFSAIPAGQTGTFEVNGGSWVGFRLSANVAVTGSATAFLRGSYAVGVITIDNIIDVPVIGAAAQTVIVNNILTTTAGTNGSDLLSYRSVCVQVVSTGTAGTFIFEGSNDPVNNFQTIPVWNQLILTGTPITAAITATASQIGYIFPRTFRYIRLRIVTTITGGSIQALSTYSQSAFAPPVQQIAQNTAANLLATVSGTVTANQGTMVALPAGANLIGAISSGIPEAIADVASAAITTTATTAIITPTRGSSYIVNIPITVVSGTLPTLDVNIEESDDSGTTWFTVYSFPRIIAAGFLRSPKLPLTGNRVRYVQTLSGTTPSFTRAINRLQSNDTAPIYRQLIDRSIVLTTLNSTTPSLIVGGAQNITLELNIGTATTVPVLTLEGSGDNGVTWYIINSGATLTATANSTVTLTLNGFSPQLIRARISTIGATVVAGYVLLRTF